MVDKDPVLYVTTIYLSHVLRIFWHYLLACSISVSCRQSQNSLNTAGTGKTPQKTEPNDVAATKKTKSTEAARLTEADKANTGRVWVSHLYVRMWDHGISIWFWDLVNVVCCAGEAVCVLGVHEGYRLAPVHLQYLSVLLSSSVLSGLKLLAQSLDRWPCYQQHTAQQRDAFRGVWSPRTHTRWFKRHSCWLCIIAYIPILNSWKLAFNMTTCIQGYIASSTKLNL